MAVLDAPQREAGTVERGTGSVRAQRFLDVLQGAFQLTWERPEALQQAMSELSGTQEQEAKAGLRVLWEYVKALSPSLSSMCGVGGREGEAKPARQTKGRRKRRKRGGGGGRSVGGGDEDELEGSADEEEAAPEQSLSPAALGQDDKTDTATGECGVCRVAGDVRRPGIVPSHSRIAARRRESCVQGVLSDKDLLGCVLSFVGGQTGRQSVKALGRAAVVCRVWREVATWDAWWAGVAEEVVPALWREGEQGGRQRLVQYGRLLLGERRVWGANDWFADLELHAEVFDCYDGLQMMSVSGHLVWDVREEDDVIALGCGGEEVMTVAGASFSATSRTRDLGGFPDIEHYCRDGSLVVRVTVRDKRTGRGGVLWEETFWTPRWCEALGPYWEEQLPEGSMAVVSERNDRVGGACDGLQCWTEFFVCPEPSQEGLAGQDRRYRVATDRNHGYMHGEYPVSLMFGGTDIAKVRQAIRALC